MVRRLHRRAAGRPSGPPSSSRSSLPHYGVTGGMRGRLTYCRKRTRDARPDGGLSAEGQVSGRRLSAARRARVDGFRRRALHAAGSSTRGSRISAGRGITGGCGGGHRIAAVASPITRGLVGVAAGSRRLPLAHRAGRQPARPDHAGTASSGRVLHGRHLDPATEDLAGRGITAGRGPAGTTVRAPPNTRGQPHRRR